MGYAKIVGGGENGRYTIELDFGKSIRDSALAQANAFIIKTEADIASTLVKITAEEAKLPALRAQHTAAVNEYIEAAEFLLANGKLPPGATELSTKAIDILAAQIKKQQLKSDPLRRVLDSLRFALRQARQQAAQIGNVNATSVRDAWCTTLTEEHPAGSFVATCDIPGDSNLVLIAPECRAPVRGFNTVTPAEKAATLARLNAGLAARTQEMAAKVEQITAGVAAETTFTEALAAARATYTADPTGANRVAVDAASAALTRKQQDVLTLRNQLSTITARYISTQREIVRWTAKAVSDTPTYGDGQLRARGLMTPEQSFWNAAVQPGWQKYKPTYRWGTATAIDYVADTMTVALFDQKSSVSSMPVNQTSTLSQVPVEYMACNAGAFLIDDRVVVEFEHQNWKKPKVIGFLDNPRSCGWPCIQLSANNYYFGAPSDSAWHAINNDHARVVEVKINGRYWEPVPLHVIGGVTLPDFHQTTFVFNEPPGVSSLVFLRIQDFTGSQGNNPGVKTIYVHVGPGWPQPPAARIPERNTAEFRIKLNGVVVFNVAIQDVGWLGWNYPGAAKTLAGITGDKHVNLVLPLDYTLTGRTP